MSSFYFDDNHEASQAIDLIESTNQSIFLTGRAGTGKSTLLRHIIENTRKKTVVLASTGVAALNIKGQTIHRFFRFKLRPYLPEDPDLPRNAEMIKMCRKIELFVIDEVSMVRADIMTAIDLTLRKALNTNKPFGGKQLLLVGDILQLPPVLNSNNEEEVRIMQANYRTTFFFSAHLFEKLNLKIIELKKVYRQEDQKFVRILDKIRVGKVDNRELEVINSRYEPSPSNYSDEALVLTPRKRLEEELNQRALKKLKDKLHKFYAEITGSFQKDKTGHRYPAPVKLELKIGARIMFVKNDPQDRWVNGTLGKVLHFYDDEERIEVTIDDAPGTYDVSQVKWSDYEYKWNKDKGRIDQEEVGTFLQFPIKLAWASTIHKCQGLTLEKVEVDLTHGAFAKGQTYVALSRATSLDGLKLRTKVQHSDIRVSKEALEFLYDQNNRLE